VGSDSLGVVVVKGGDKGATDGASDGDADGPVGMKLKEPRTKAFVTDVVALQALDL